jgi:glutamyl-tRNA(Gln) amidotransferase subunit E
MRIGLEVHQQLDTTHKLFCECPTKLLDGESQFRFRRTLRASRSELGEVDSAALFEEQRSKEYIYEADWDTSCLVEMDEEPPHELNREALEAALEVAHLVGAKPVDEIQVMRKLVIDGSNTSGFQRTSLVAIGGAVFVGEKKVRISTICLEEDAARKVGEEPPNSVVYRLDRLGIPLIEISTEPDITTPEEAEQVAREIGGVLRRTRKTKRGLGTIRQDLNISVEGGARVEVKGIQELGLIPRIAAFEAQRQSSLLSLRSTLLSRGLDRIVVSRPVDLTQLFSRTDSRIISGALLKGKKVLGIRVEGFSGFFGFPTGPGRRFGTEVAEYVGQFTGLRGILHSDELPGYGITTEEVERVRSTLGCTAKDAFMLVIGSKELALRALEVAARRISAAIDGVVQETRAPQQDGTTRFSRPMPGAERMYPETDVPHIQITGELLSEVKAKIPPPLESTRERMVSLGVSDELARQAVESDMLQVLEDVLEKRPQAIKLAAGLLLQDAKELEAEGTPSKAENSDLVRFVVAAHERNFSRDLLKSAFKAVLSGEARPEEALERIRSDELDLVSLRVIIRGVLEKNASLVRERGESAFKPLMGEVMEKVRGRFPGSVVAEELRKLLSGVSQERSG